MSIEITEELFDAVLGPIALAAVLTGFEATINEIGDIDNEWVDGLESWPEEMRLEVVKSLTETAERIRSWATDVIDYLDGVPRA